MWHTIFYGLLLGWGAAIPLGPLNLEMIRRNLRFGTPVGIALGLGACSADLTYLVLLMLGALAILMHAMVLKIVSVIGSLVLCWFGVSALRMRVQQQSAVSPGQSGRGHLFKHWLQGYGMTLLNPYTILFWFSVSVQVATFTKYSGSNALYFVATGVMLGTLSWVLMCNLTLHFTRHRFSDRLMHYLNIVGGVILIGFAVYGIWRAFYVL